MNPSSIALAARPARSLARVRQAGLVAGALDLCLAMLVQFTAVGYVNLPRILKLVASGLLGPDARQGGPAVAGLGLVLHFLIATIWAAIYFTLRPRLTWLARATESGRGRVMVGLAYGLVIYVAMNYIVVPLSRATTNTRLSWPMVLMIVGHAVLIGLPIVTIIGNDRS